MAMSLRAEKLDAIELPNGARGRVTTLKHYMHHTKHLLAPLTALARYEAKQIASEMPEVDSTKRKKGRGQSVAPGN